MLLLALASRQGFSGEIDRKLSSLLQTKRLNGTFFTDDSVPPASPGQLRSNIP